MFSITEQNRTELREPRLGYAKSANTDDQNSWIFETARVRRFFLGCSGVLAMAFVRAKKAHCHHEGLSNGQWPICTYEP
jgi:hypothetical protein